MTLHISSYCRLLISLAFLLSAAVCNPALAGDQIVRNEPDGQSIAGRSLTVKFADLDLDTDRGRRELLERLSKAADRVCREHAITLTALGPGVYEFCYRHSLAAAVERVHQRQLSALFAATWRSNMH